MGRIEVDRVGVMQQVTECSIPLRDAVARLGSSVRRVKRLPSRFRGKGAQDLVSRPRGRCPGNI